MFAAFKRRFWQPPRAHGEVIEDRTVSFLELFYDLVYVVVIARAAHHLAEHVSWRGVYEFAVIFGLIWAGWLQGTLYYDVHGREDGRTRTFVFAQMLLLGLLAVFTGDAATTTGREFAIVYAIFLGLLTVFWYTVRRQDSEEYRALTGRYLTIMSLSVLLILVSAFVGDEARLMIWGLFVVSWVGFSLLLTRNAEFAQELGMTATDSMVERFGLFTIIVLGEVVVGVVEGMSEAVSPLAIATGLVGLMIGFSFWWTYFDFAGRRLPDQHATPQTQWILSHLPLSMAIAAAGAGMVSLVEHADDSRAPAATAWLISGSVALMLVSLVLVLRTLRDWDRLPMLYRPVARVAIVAAAGSLVIALLRPAPIVLVALLVLLLSAVWTSAIIQWMGMENPDEAYPEPH